MSEQNWSSRPRITSEQVAALRDALKDNENPSIAEFLNELDYIESQHDGSDYAKQCEAYVNAAREHYQQEGDCSTSVDVDAVISDSGTGAYVQAWVWVYAEDAGVEQGVEEVTT